MLGYALFGSNDVARAHAFYDEVLALLGAMPVMQFGDTKVWGTTGLEFGVGKPFNGAPATAGNGTMVALNATTRAQVDAVHAKALALGGTDEGAPGIRGEDPNGFYAAYFRDLDGNKLAIFRMGPPD